jgi:hypothetical protein
MSRSRMAAAALLLAAPLCASGGSGFEDAITPARSV